MWDAAPQAGSLSLRRLLADAGIDGVEFIGVKRHTRQDLHA